MPSFHLFQKWINPEPNSLKYYTTSATLLATQSANCLLPQWALLFHDQLLVHFRPFGPLHLLDYCATADHFDIPGPFRTLCALGTEWWGDFTRFIAAASQFRDHFAWLASLADLSAAFSAFRYYLHCKSVNHVCFDQIYFLCHSSVFFDFQRICQISTQDHLWVLDPTSLSKQAIKAISSQFYHHFTPHFGHYF